MSKDVKDRRPRGRTEIVRLKDLSPRKKITGGSDRIVFGQGTSLVPVDVPEPQPPSRKSP